MTVRLHPDDYAAAGAARVAQLAGSNVTIVADAHLSRGGCRIESDMGMLDAGVDAQLQEVARALLGDDDGGVAARATSRMRSAGGPVCQWSERASRSISYIERLAADRHHAALRTRGPHRRPADRVDRAARQRRLDVRRRRRATARPAARAGRRLPRLDRPVGAARRHRRRPPRRPHRRPRGRAVGSASAEALLGRVIDALGRPLDGGGPIRRRSTYPLHPPPLNPMARDPVAAAAADRRARHRRACSRAAAASVSACSAAPASARAR